jgi:hypothetical protein
MSLLLITLVVFFAILVAVVVLRIRGGEKFDIKSPDILLALIPIAIWLVLTNKVKVIEFGGFKIETALVNAAEAAVASQVTPITSKLPVDPLRAGPKGSVSEIPSLVEARTEALIFQLGGQGYYGPAIGTYLQELSAHPFFKYIVINQSDGKFAGVADGRQFAAMVKVRPGYADDFVKWLEKSDANSLTNLPGYVSAATAVEPATDRLTALQRMETLDLDALPVLDKDGKLAGQLKRSRLLSSLISEALKKVK